MFSAAARNGPDSGPHAVDPDLICGICQDVQRDAVLYVECGHSFCETCSTRARSEKDDCPSCRTAVENVFPDKRNRRKVDQLVIKCSFGPPHHGGPQPPQVPLACTWQGRIDQLEDHRAAHHTAPKRRRPAVARRPAVRQPHVLTAVESVAAALELLAARNRLQRTTTRGVPRPHASELHPSYLYYDSD